ncbi:Uma2 family endonuclease [Hymenobacter caeli]|uniref:Uma2 family endonuclease n=1 Tax=Hymenobacter caeli TaxID=2735894 RepID=A0ABX2FRV2_9BACT|nr:Uma2 family endonuclease [Hymenobacter caeli]NRT19917.1 Uma2 family endonuclease [Hymenobacter caeli]
MKQVSEAPVPRPDAAEATVLRGALIAGLSDDEFFQFCQENDLVRIERTADHEISIMPPVGGDSSATNGDVYFQLALWSRRYGGRSFESSVGFYLSEGIVLSPDVSWVPAATWARLTAQQRRKFLPVCPDFIIEVKSPSDNLKTLQAKMEQWLQHGVRLGFLLNTETETAYVYAPGQPVQTVQGFDQELSGEPVLPGFRLDLRELKS